MESYVFSGIIKTLSNSVSVIGEDKGLSKSAQTYSFIELADGQHIKNVIVMGGLNSKLSEALNNAQRVELHVAKRKNRHLLMAVRMESGQHFAMENPGKGGAFYGLMVIAAIATFFFLVGLANAPTPDAWKIFLPLYAIFMIAPAMAIKNALYIKSVNQYTANLPKVIYIG